MNLSKVPKFLSILNRIYKNQASVVIISGDWKTGKTDFGLLLAEILLSLGLIDKVASNIEIYKDRAHKERTDDPVKLIQSLISLKLWGSEKGRKLYIYDEVIESSPGRSSMSKLNVEWVRFIPQMSKMHIHLLVLTQVENLADSVFRNPVFCFGLWYKSKYTSRDRIVHHTSRFTSPKLRLDEYKLRDVPATSIIFDPDKIATFSLQESSTDLELLPRTLQVAMLYHQGQRMRDIERALNIQRIQIQREFRKICQIVVTLLHSDSVGKRVLEISNETEKTTSN